MSIGQLIEIFRSVSGVAFDVVADSARIRDNEIETTSGDPTLAQDVLGWSPRITLTQTLLDTLQFWRAIHRARKGPASKATGRRGEQKLASCSNS